MCNLSEGILRTGRREGSMETELRAIRSMMDSTGWTAEKIMEMMNTPEENRPFYAAQLHRQ